MLSKEDDVRQYVIKRPLPAKEGKENKKQRYKAPKIQRLVTPAMLQRKRHRLALKRRRAEKNRQASRNLHSREFSEPDFFWIPVFLTLERMATDIDSKKLLGDELNGCVTLNVRKRVSKGARVLFENPPRSPLFGRLCDR